MKCFLMKLSMVVMLISIMSAHAASKNYIEVYKKNVLHKFVPFNNSIDGFVTKVFPQWENETFDVFDQVKDPKGIAIDLGAWIGTTAIWLSKNFKHVVAVEPDVVSLECLKRNLQVSQCSNVTLCKKPVASTREYVVFGPRGNELNESISYIKPAVNNKDDYVIRGITFKRLIHDYIFTNPNIEFSKISFIKCDIEGGEEDIIEDILYFAYYNKVKVYMSFHLDWWKSKKIADIEYLFRFFRTNCPESNIAEYIRKNPFASLLFEPIEGGEALIKKNMPAVIIGYNQVTYIKNMVEQLEKYTSDIIIIDNNSSFKPLLDYYENEFKYTLLKKNINYGHTVYRRKSIQRLVGDVFLLTDPDIKFNPHLPDNFIQTLLDISHYYQAFRVGFALCIDAPDIRTDITHGEHTIQEWEKQYWQDTLYYELNPELELYKADIDTTFCLVHKKYESLAQCVRVAGDFTCTHIPWHTNFKDGFMEGEYDAYLQRNTTTTWFKEPSDD